MRLAVAAAALIALTGMVAPPAAAAEGDLWAVQRQGINVRSGPSTNTDVLMTIGPGDRIVEVAAKGDWFFVEFPDHGARGWVYRPLLVRPDAVAVAAAPQAAPSPAPAATSRSIETTEAAATPPTDVAAEPAAATQTAAVDADGEPAAVKSFRETVAELNDRAVSVAGIHLFRDVRSTGGGAIQVLATDTWATVPEAGQSSYMNALFDRWQSMATGLGPLSLQIVDPSGQVMMERTGS
ncbi:MAG: SH3 domain-containing protein [Alphaproteobacteria bacterium]